MRPILSILTAAFSGAICAFSAEAASSMSPMSFVCNATLQQLTVLPENAQPTSPNYAQSQYTSGGQHMVNVEVTIPQSESDGNAKLQGYGSYKAFVMPDGSPLNLSLAGSSTAGNKPTCSYNIYFPTKNKNGSNWNKHIGVISLSYVAPSSAVKLQSCYVSKQNGADKIHCNADFEEATSAPKVDIPASALESDLTDK